MVAKTDNEERRFNYAQLSSEQLSSAQLAVQRDWTLQCVTFVGPCTCRRPRGGYRVDICVAELPHGMCSTCKCLAHPACLQDTTR